MRNKKSNASKRLVTQEGRAERILETIRRKYYPELWLLMENYLSLAKERQILDVGTGHGWFASALARSGWQVTVTDPTVPCLTAARQRIEANGCLATDYQKCNAKKLPFVDNRFPCLISVNHLEFCHDPLKALEEMHRVMVPKGLGVISTFNRRSPWGLGKLPHLTRYDDYQLVLKTMTERDFKNLLRKAKFEINTLRKLASYSPDQKYFGARKLPWAGSFVAFVSKR